MDADVELFDRNQEIWDHFADKPDDGHAGLPSTCHCHDLPSGSCPTRIHGVVRLVMAVGNVGVPNMDGLPIPLHHRTFNPDVWRPALGSFFDARALLDAMVFGWDQSFSSPLEPLDAPRNLGSASMAAEDVDAYITNELRYGSIVGPLDPATFPFRLYHNPIGTVPRSNSSTRRTIAKPSHPLFGAASQIIQILTHFSLILYLSMLQYANLVPASRTDINWDAILLWKNVRIIHGGVVPNITKSKVNQFSGCVHQIPLTASADARLCLAVCFTSLAEMYGPAFCLRQPVGTAWDSGLRDDPTQSNICHTFYWVHATLHSHVWTTFAFHARQSQAYPSCCRPSGRPLDLPAPVNHAFPPDCPRVFL